MYHSKKASLNLSINAIVILILAITMLGLGLAFMKNIFGGATEEFTKVGGEVEKQMIEQMKSSKEVVQLSRASLDLKRGEKDQIFIGLSNNGKGQSSLVLNMRFEKKAESDSMATSTSDFSPYGNDGTVIGAEWKSIGGHDGGGAYQFDTSDRIPINPSETFNTPYITVSAWVKKATLTNWMRIVTKYWWGGSNFGSWAMDVGNVNHARCYMNISGGFYVSSSPADTLPLDTWTFVACTFNGTHIVTYVNGVPQATRGAIGTIGDSDFKVTIGAGNNKANYQAFFNGMIDDVMIFNRALNPEHIQMVYEGKASQLLKHGFLLVEPPKSDVGDVPVCDDIELETKLTPTFVAEGQTAVIPMNVEVKSSAQESTCIVNVVVCEGSLLDLSAISSSDNDCTAGGVSVDQHAIELIVDVVN